ncbi:MAG: hypothetical protein R3B68_01720 [Phycisphaerales bacterium]
MPDDPDDLVMLTSAASELQAGLWISVLESHGIRAVSPGSAATTLRWEVGSTDPHRLYVRRADAERAREVLDNQRSDSIDIDWNDVDVGTPEDAPEPEASASAGAPSRTAIVVVIGAIAIGVFIWLVVFAPGVFERP